MTRHLILGLATLFVASSAYAVPYASGIRNTTGSIYEFVLNQDADNVTVKRDGGNAINMGSLSAGRYTFDLAAFGTFDIEVSNSAAAGYTTISDNANDFLWFERPAGLAVNTDPTSSLFGTFYVANSTDLSTSIPGVRATSDGIYAFSADQTGIDASTYAAAANAAAAPVAQPAAWNVGGSTTSPWRMNIDDGGNLIVSDWSDANGGIKYISGDLQTAGVVLGTQQGPTGGVPGSNHGSIVSQPTVTGTVGVDLTVWAMDEDLASAAGDGNNVWRWDVGAATDYTGAANLILDPSTLPAAANGETTFLNLNIGVIADMVYSPANDKLYMTQNRNSGNEAGLIVVDASTGTLEFSSLDFTVNNGLDGFPGEFDFITSDILRNVGEITLSEDGSTLFINRIGIDDGEIEGIDFTNPHLGPASNQPGAVLVIPLDGNGIPEIVLDENGTPGDTSDDLISNWDSITLENNDNLGIRNSVRLDAAGNVYTASNFAERVQVHSPGGNTKATTSNNAALTAGAFAVAELVLIDGDYNGDGVVDAADYTVYRDSLGSSVDLAADGNNNGVIDPGDYTVWQNNFGATASSATAVPEPAAAVMLAAGLAGLLARRRG